MTERIIEARAKAYAACRQAQIACSNLQQAVNGLRINNYKNYDLAAAADYLENANRRLNSDSLKAIEQPGVVEALILERGQK